MIYCYAFICVSIFIISVEHVRFIILRNMMYWREIHCKISENPATKAVFFRGKSSAPAWSNQKAFFVAIMLPKLDQVDVNLITLRLACSFYHFLESEGTWDEKTPNLIKSTLAWSSWTWLCWYFGTSAGAGLMME